ncbi:SMI1/KNR4 family protein [Pedobacter sp. 22226]|uniref:SMI1/KNR4 family protein n=1 Tax=Pedobacter sp. 22226 TaxID=3453894 RepID=UPI003F86F03F
MQPLKQLFENKKTVIKKLGITFNDPCREEDIADLQSKLSQPLPSDLIDFYTFCNGIETEDFMFRVIPISEVIDYRSELKSNTLHFAEYMIYSDQWLIQLNEGGGYNILNNDHGSKETTVQSNSIFEFLEIYLTEGLFSKSDNNSFWDRLSKSRK